MLGSIQGPNGDYFIEMEFVPSEMWGKVRRDSRLSERKARFVVSQVANGLEYLHEKGITHRDIKLENILFSPGVWDERLRTLPASIYSDIELRKEIGLVKICDFGFAKLIFDDMTATPLGTVGYAAPEVISESRYDKSVDVWALGCVMYTLLAGYTPFSVSSSAVLKGIFGFPAKEWDTITEQAKSLISEMLQADPLKRIRISDVPGHSWITGVRASGYHRPSIGAGLLRRCWRPLPTTLKTPLMSPEWDNGGNILTIGSSMVHQMSQTLRTDGKFESEWDHSESDSSFERTLPLKMQNATIFRRRNQQVVMEHN
ncbi:kinase-like domain-containing protein [Cladochytrium replicatum]|nr:kinase-like domain-containing protein [Cladochytrium replicatum]